MTSLEPRPIDGASIGHRLAVSAVLAWKDLQQLDSRDEAVLALQAGAALPAADAAALLDVTAAAHQAAVEAVPSHVRPRRARPWAHASEKDIDRPPCLAAMREVAPTLPAPVREHLLSWVVHWHWVR